MRKFILFRFWGGASKVRPRKARLNLERLEDRIVPSAAYTPAQIQQAYGVTQLLNKGYNGAGTTIAIVDVGYDPNIVGDLQAFDALYGLPNLSAQQFTQVGQLGNAITTNNHPALATMGQAGEEALDVEWAHAMAPGANIILVETNTNTSASMLAGVNYASAHANVVSMSYGTPGFQGEQNNDSNYLATGVTFIASVGDSGSINNQGAYPADSPNVISVGGTALTINADGSYGGETVWNEQQNGGGATGGGISNYELQPAYQHAAEPNQTMRTTPDVAFDADGHTGVSVYNSYNEATNGNNGSPLFTDGGTSVGSPCWAGIIAITDQIRAAHGLSSLSGASQTLPALYGIYANPTQYAADFNDITQGNNGTFSATPGYDLVTRLGTPKAYNLAFDLAGVSDTVTGVTSTTSNGAYSAGANVLIDVTFSAPVTVTGTPQLALNSGGTANYTSGSGTNTLVFTYQVGAGDNTPAGTHLDAASASALTLNGGTLSGPGVPVDLGVPIAPASGALGVNKSIIIDTVAPVTTASLSGTLGSNGWYTSSSVSVSLSANDTNSGVANTYYTIDGGSLQSYTGAFSVSGEGSHSISFFSTDLAGNTEATKTVSFNIDSVPPTSSISLPSSGGMYTTGSWPGFSGTATDATSGLQKVEVSILQTSTGNYWDGSGFNSSTEVFFTATGTANWSYSFPASSFPSYGSYQVYAQATDNAGNVEPSGPSATFTIIKTTPTVAVSDNGGTFNGSTFPATATVNGASSLEGVTPTLDYVQNNSDGSTTDLGANAPSAAGNYTVTASFAGSADYTSASASTTFTISQATATVAVSDNGGTFNGSTFPATATVNGASSLEGVTPTLDYVQNNSDGSTTDLGANAPSAAGNYTVTASFAGSADYTSASASTTFTISQATATVAVSDNGGTFNGSTFPATATVNGASSLEGVTPTLDYVQNNSDGSTTDLGANAPSAAGNYTVTASFAGSADYTSASASTTFTISQATATVAVSDNGGTFNGSTFPATATVNGASSLEGVKPTLDYVQNNSDGSTTDLGANAPSAAGNYTVTASFAGSADYAAASKSVNFTISQATATVAVSDNGGTFNGSAFPATATVNGASSLEGVKPTLDYVQNNSDGSTTDLSANAPSAAGNYTVTASFAGSADYTSASASTTFTISQATATVAVSDNGGTFNGSTFPATATVNGASSLEGAAPTLDYVQNNSDGSTTDLGANAPSAAGSYTVTASFAGSADYAAASKSVNFTISQAATATTLTTSVANAIPGQPVTFTATVSSTAGTPTGSVDFVDTTTGIDLGSVALSGGTAVLTTSALASGSQTIVARYNSSDTGNFQPSSSAGLTQTVADSIVLLDTTDSGALSMSGNASIQVAGVVVDSSSVTAVTQSGNSKVKAGAIHVHGGVHLSGNASDSTTPITGDAGEADPLAGLAAPTGGVSQSAVNLTKGSLTINPGVYSSINVLGNASLTLEPGVYIIAGGGLTVSGNASVSGNGVMIYNAGSNYSKGGGGTYGAITLSGNASVKLTAPATDPDEGITLFQARGNSQAISLSGNAVLSLGGTLYAPTALVSLSGNASLSGAIVADELALSGNAMEA